MDLKPLAIVALILITGALMDGPKTDAAPAPTVVPSVEPVIVPTYSCDCSDECTCGCNQDQECDCERSSSEPVEFSSAVSIVGGNCANGSCGTSSAGVSQGVGMANRNRPMMIGRGRFLRRLFGR